MTVQFENAFTYAVRYSVARCSGALDGYTEAGPGIEVGSHRGRYTEANAEAV
jgi:hypothetical protein